MLCSRLSICAICHCCHCDAPPLTSAPPPPPPPPPPHLATTFHSLSQSLAILLSNGNVAPFVRYYDCYFGFGLFFYVNFVRGGRGWYWISCKNYQVLQVCICLNHHVHVSGPCPEDIFWIFQHSVTKLGMVVHHRETECPWKQKQKREREKKHKQLISWRWWSQGGLNSQNMTVSTVSSEVIWFFYNQA